MTSKLLHGVRSRLRSSPRRDLHSAIAGQRQAFERATWVVRAFYATSVALVLFQMGRWVAYVEVTAIEPQWPARWLRDVDLGTGIRLILIGHVATALWAMVQPDRRVARAASFLLLLQYVAMINGFGKVNHDLHAWLWVSGILVFLPDRWDRRLRASDRQVLLTVVWACQVVVLFFYTLTGLWKVWWAARDLLNPAAMSAFELDGFSYIVAERLLATNQVTLLGELLVRTPAVGWLLYNGTMYLEATSLLIAFRPRLHRLWGLGLITFHLGTQLAMGFTFRHNVVLIGLLFVCSPWAPDRSPLRDVLLDLPGIRIVARQVARVQVRSAADGAHQRPVPVGASTTHRT